jgi:hypothetical protein
LKKLVEYAEQMEKSGRKSDAVIARYIRTHEGRLEALLSQVMRQRGGRGSKRLTKEDRDEMVQVLLLGCVEAVTAPDSDTALRNIHNVMQRHARGAVAWNTRRAFNEET